MQPASKRRMITSPQPSIKPLQITSCLMGTVVIHAYILRRAVFHHLFLLVTIMSVLFHSTHHPIIALLDKVCAHAAFLYIMLDVPNAINAHREWVLGFPAMVACLWFAQSMYEAGSMRRDHLHTMLHVVTIAGLHCWLYEIYYLHRLYK